MDKQNDRPGLEVQRCAFFFDVDGTLAEIQPRPELVFIPPRSLVALEHLHVSQIPVAVISGRPLSQLDDLLSPLCLPAAGVHGAERRTAEGDVQSLSLDLGVLDAIQRELLHACARHPGLSLENKTVAFALHFRLSPELEGTARAIAEDFVQRYGDVLALQPGKCVFELKPRGASKGEVIRTFMREAPFKGQVPVFVGDDLTDEAGFKVVNELGGLTIKVGGGPTEATRRLDSVEAVGAWLESLVSGLSDQPEHSKN